METFTLIVYQHLGFLLYPEKYGRDCLITSLQKMPHIWCTNPTREILENQTSKLDKIKSLHREGSWLFEMLLTPQMYEK